MEKEKNLEVKQEKKKGMTLPNKLTLFRILLVPAMVIIYYIPYLKNHEIFLNISIANFVAALIFIVASLTDLADGKIARKYNLVTTFGKFADPLADKILVITAMILLASKTTSNMGYSEGVVPLYILIIVVIREFIVSGVRLVCAQKGEVIAAGKLGKYKTATTMVALVILFFYEINKVVFWIGTGFIILAGILTIISGIEYFWKNRKPILESI